MGVASEVGTRSGPRLGPSISELSAAFRSGETTPADVCRQVLAEIAERGADGVWITVADDEAVLARCAALAEIDDPSTCRSTGSRSGSRTASTSPAGRPRWPVPEYAYVATETAPVVQRLLDAGAILIGKTNLDQFATGLNGTRTPYPMPAQRVRPGPDLRRVELRVGAGGGARRGAVHGGHRHGRLRPGAAGAQRGPRLQAVPRTRSAPSAWCRPAAPWTASA